MLKTEGGQFAPYTIFKMRSMVRYQLFRDAESSDNMVEEEMGSCVSFTIEGRHGFRPFGEIIDGDNDVLMAVR